ncbi:MAG: thioredoxin domain-containing protein [bacterium]|nr:thioredoxin domain-containing protein [bacterium]
MRVLRWLLVISVMLLAAGVVAQDDAAPPGTILDVLGGLRVTTVGGADDPYADIPQSRTEDGAFVLGNPDAALVVVEFADFLCPHCQEYEEILDQFIENHVATGEARLEYRLVPIVNEVYSPLTARVAECAGEQGRFWEARQLLFNLAREQAISENVAQVVADQLGLNASLLESCIPTADQFQRDVQVAQGAGVTGTPAVMIRVNDSNLQWVSVQGQVLDRGGLPYELLAQLVQRVQQASGG